ncbi:hypothetical protein [Halalkalibacter hemicellulosilyticus]|uniref:Membrane protein n=1 Tax=Halalkalibacter hemicellulosilyticusJCM 9152 TaxID=1236971 RepID=W4Q9J9_9BACI|nr:hypothetical protein [Halalkalibacter hemicellulosilyticus]GAE28675.1 membrane protein [Halalkalibacter hemicellulosilyticusJCM 9152]
MQVFSTYEHSTYLELCITELEQMGIDKESILAVPLDNRVEQRKLLDTLHRADGVSLFDKGAAIGTAFSVIGASIGFTLEWGPIYWGLIGAASGFILGFIIDYILFKVVHKRKRQIRGKTSEVILVVNCSKDQIEKVEKILWANLALGVATLENS